MKRFRRIMSLDKVTEALARESSSMEFRDALVKSLPSRIFGETMAAHIDDAYISGKKLHLVVSDPIWRKEIQKNRGRLVDKVRAVHPQLIGITVDS